MNENIQSKLAINIAQLSLDKATLEAHNESLRETISQLEQEIAQLKEQNDISTEVEE